MSDATDRPTPESLYHRFLALLSQAEEEGLIADKSWTRQRFALQEAKGLAEDLVRMGRERPVVTPAVPMTSFALGDRVRVIDSRCSWLGQSGRVENLARVGDIGEVLFDDEDGAKAWIYPWQCVRIGESAKTVDPFGLTYAHDFSLSQTVRIVDCEACRRGELGKVIGFDMAAVHVRFDNGDVVLYLPSELRSVQPGTSPEDDAIHQGADAAEFGPKADESEDIGEHAKVKPVPKLRKGQCVRIISRGTFSGRKGRIQGFDHLGDAGVMLDGDCTSRALVIFPPSCLEPDDEAGPITVLAPSLMAESVDRSEDPVLTKRILPPHYYDPHATEDAEPTPLEVFTENARVKCIDDNCPWTGISGTVVEARFSGQAAQIKIDRGPMIFSSHPEWWSLTDSPGSRPSLTITSTDDAEPFSEEETAQLDRVFRRVADKHARRKAVIGDVGCEAECRSGPALSGKARVGRDIFVDGGKGGIS
jgi:hypothetical protein